MLHSTYFYVIFFCWVFFSDSWVYIHSMAISDEQTFSVYIYIFLVRINYLFMFRKCKFLTKPSTNKKRVHTKRTAHIQFCGPATTIENISPIVWLHIRQCIFNGGVEYMHSMRRWQCTRAKKQIKRKKSIWIKTFICQANEIICKNLSNLMLTLFSPNGKFTLKHI